MVVRVVPRISFEISIHAPREGRDVNAEHLTLISSGFQSTRPARGATFSKASTLFTSSYFNPRAPRGARPSISGG